MDPRTIAARALAHLVESMQHPELTALVQRGLDADPENEFAKLVRDASATDDLK